MYRGTTPQIKLTLDTNLNLEEIANMWVTFKGMAIEITKTQADCIILNEDKEIRVNLTQDDTLKLQQGKVRVQVRFRMNSGKAYATSIGELQLNGILKEGVV